MQTMELDRITEMEKFIQTYSIAIKTLADTMNQVYTHFYGRGKNRTIHREINDVIYYNA